MSIGDYLKTNQPLIYRTFVHAVESHRVSHAYLLSGEPGTPLQETALFLAKSLLCDHPNPLADEACRTCLRIDHGSYGDLLMLNGEKATIKKDDIQAIVGDFSKTPLEEKGIMIYIIHLVENMTVDAVNSLLKFLEEPSKNTFAFLTTENEAKVLPTIVSRCETLRLLLQPRKSVIADAVSKGASENDAELLSYFCNSGDLVLQEAKEEDFQLAKQAFEATLSALSKPRNAAIFDFESKILPAISSKEDGRYFLDMLSLAYKDLIALSESQPISLSSYATLLASLSSHLRHLGPSLLEIMKVRSQLDSNISVSLSLEHLINFITKEF